MGRKSIDSVEIPGYQGRAVLAPAGSIVRVTNVEGCQIADFFALIEDDFEELLSPAVTRLATFKMFPDVGEAFYSNRHRAVLTLLEDNSPGTHDMTFACCDSPFYVSLGCTEPHPNCHDNFLDAMQRYGHPVEDVPDPVNLFQSSYPRPDGGFDVAVIPAKAGDYVEMRAEMNLVVAATACSVDVDFDGVWVQGAESTPVRIDIFEA
jgi:uncharacterized protein YcgI (DUF1989 family)